MKNSIVFVLVTLLAGSAAYALPPKDCRASTKAWMPTGAEMAAACSFEPLFKEPITELGSERSCHYDFGKLAGMAGLDVSRDAQKSAEAAAKGAVAMYAQMPGYSGEARKMPWDGIDAHEFMVTKGGKTITSGYYVATKTGLFKIELWTSDRTKSDSCAEKVVRNIIQRIGG